MGRVGGLGVEAHDIAAMQQRPEPAVQGDGLGQLVELGGVEVQQVALDTQAAEQRCGGAERKIVAPAGGVRTLGPMWAPIISAGMSIDAPRWIVWRSSGSLQSLVHTRTVRSSISWSIRPPPDEQLSNSTPGWSSRSMSMSRYSAIVWAWVPAAPPAPLAAMWSRFMSTSGS